MRQLLTLPGFLVPTPKQGASQRVDGVWECAFAYTCHGAQQVLFGTAGERQTVAFQILPASGQVCDASQARPVARRFDAPVTVPTSTHDSASDGASSLDAQMATRLP